MSEGFLGLSAVAPFLFSSLLSQFSSVSQAHPTLCDLMDCSMPGFPVHHQLPEFTQIHVHWVGYAIQPFHLLSSASPLPSIFSSIKVFSKESILCIRWPKYWSFSFSISPSNEYSGLISFRMDWLDLLVVQGTLKSLLQHHSSKMSILWSSAFFIVQLSHPYMTTGKTLALTKWTFVGKVMSLLFNMLSRLVIAFLPRSKGLLISWLQAPSTVILEPPPQIKSVTVSTVYPSICHEVVGPDAMILVFWMLSFKPAFSLSSFTFIKRLFSSSWLSAIREVSSQMYRTDFWTLGEKVRVGCFKRTASKHVCYLGWKRSPAQVGCMRQVLGPGALGRPRGSGWRRRWEEGSGWGIHVNPWLIQVNVWQKPLQYCKVISLQLIKINEKKFK